MRAVKRLIDPHGVLSPGVVLTDDPQAHLQNLKTAPTIEAIADRCIECGFCESVCPSRRVTTTPRQRIALRREMVRQPQGSPVAEELAGAYAYDAVQTCAGDGIVRPGLPGGDQHRRPDEVLPGAGPPRPRPGHRPDRRQALPADAAARAGSRCAPRTASGR